MRHISAMRARQIARRLWGVLICALFFTLPSLCAAAEKKAEIMPYPRRADTAADPAAEAIADRVLEPAMKEKRLVGLVVGVVKNGRVVVKKGYGVKSFDSPEAPDENTVFYIGSLSKAVTAVGAMLLVEKGKLDLGTPAGKYVKGMPESWRPITVTQFMAHQSGIPQLSNKLPAFEEMLKAAENRPLVFKPGAKQQYNNFNYAVTGRIIASVSDVAYLDYMKRKVFDPLHMDHTGYGIETKNEAISYRPVPPNERAAPNGPAAVNDSAPGQGGKPEPIAHELKGGEYGIPSGHLQSTLADLLKLYHAIRTGALMKRSTYELMVTRANPKFSGTLGWFQRDAGKDSIITKNGAVQGWHSIMSFVSDKGHCVIMLWTSQKPKANNMGKETNQLLNQICGVPVGPDAQAADDLGEE